MLFKNLAKDNIMWYPFFIVGTFWFYILLLAMTVSLYYCIDREWAIGATGTLLVGALALSLFGNVNIFHWIKVHPVLAVTCAVLFFVVGFCWMIAKWEIALRDRRSKIEEVKQDFYRSHKKPTATEDTITVDQLQYPRSLSENPIARNAKGPQGDVTGLKEETIKKCQTEWDNARKEGVAYIYKSYNDLLWNSLDSENCTEFNPDGERTEKMYVRNDKAKLAMWMSYWPISMSWFFCHDFIQRVANNVIEFAHKALQGRADAVFADSKVGIDAPKSVDTTTVAPAAKV